MKKIIVLLFALISFCSANAQIKIMIDPPLTASIVQQTETLKGTYKKRIKVNSKLLGIETEIAAVNEKIVKLQEKENDYLSNASGAVQNIYQLKKIAELTFKEIPMNMKLVSKSIPHNLKGAAITVIVTKQIKNIKEDILTLIPIIENVTLSGKAKNGEKVNLLNAYERIAILTQIMNKLENINNSLYILSWQIRTLNFTDLWMELSPNTWANYMQTINIYEQIKTELELIKYF